MAVPLKDSTLVAWGLNFDTKATLSPVTYSLTAAQALAFHTVYLAFTAAYNAVTAAREAGARSKLLTQTKDTAKANLLRTARELYGFIQDSNTVTIANKEDIGVNPRNHLPTPIPPPATAPVIDIVSVSGNTAKIRLHNADSTRRGKPAGVDGAAVFSFIGAVPPDDEAGWAFQGNTSQTTVNVAFPAGTAPGAKVWFTAFWFNTRKQSGPSTTPISTNIPGNAAMAA